MLKIRINFLKTGKNLYITNFRGSRMMQKFIHENIAKGLLSKLLTNQRRYDRWRKMILELMLLLGVIFAVVTYRECTLGDPLQPQIAAKILRFHVLANSDSERDQQIKLKVRDAVGSYMEPKLSGSESLYKTKQIVDANIEGVIATAEKVLKKEGVDYGATAYLTTMDFPVKTYGDYTFPAGKYEALRVVLGKGAGHNWWCVLYPNMCFRGSVYEIVEEDARQELREVLDDEEYADVFQRGKYQVRFKILELFR